MAASACLGVTSFNDRNFKVSGGPTHRASSYLRRLVEAGHKVGIVRQTETAALKAAGDSRSKLFERRLQQVYTRATLAACGDDAQLAEVLGAGSSYLVTVAEAQGGAGQQPHIALIAVETGTGDVMYGNFKDGPLRSALEGHLLTLSAGEVLLAGTLSDPTEKLIQGLYGSQGGPRLERCDTSAFAHGGALAQVAAFYSDAHAEPQRLQALMELPELVLQALAATMRHLRDFGLTAILRDATHFRNLDCALHMSLPPNALRQLEVLSPGGGGAIGGRGSLLWLMDHTKTQPGKRALHRWIARPLRCAGAIRERLDAVAALLDADEDDDAGLAVIAKTLRKLPDCERCLTRALHRSASPAEFVTGMNALAQASQRLRGAVGEAAPPLLRRLMDAASEPAVTQEAHSLLACLDADAAKAPKPDLGRLFRSSAGEGHGDATPALSFPAVDVARGAIARAEGDLAALLPLLRKQLSIGRLEYTKVAETEYLIELPDSMAVPDGWLKHSTLKGKKMARWHVPEVTVCVQALERGREELQAAAKAAWSSFLQRFGASYSTLRAAADALAQLDALQSLATLARNANYVRPTITDDHAAPQLNITAGRHPMLDALLNGAYIPNDTRLAGNATRCLVVTGPNMGGKSSYIRQVALITLMAHVGSFVPAECATLSVCDGLYTRMGACDSLATGSSTFLEEMSETSAILRDATPRSLVILDELGRGTATEDGLAIATATLTHLAMTQLPLTLFVTHFPSLAQELSQALAPAVGAAYVSYHATAGEAVAGRDREASVTFLYKLVPGVAGSSFGLNVARMAGVLPAVLARAAQKAGEAEGEAHGGGLSEEEVSAIRAALKDK